MDIADWRKKIDELDQRLVEVLNERAAAAKAIGALKRNIGFQYENTIMPASLCLRTSRASCRTCSNVVCESSAR